MFGIVQFRNVFETVTQARHYVKCFSGAKVLRVKIILILVLQMKIQIVSFYILVRITLTQEVIQRVKKLVLHFAKV